MSETGDSAAITGLSVPTQLLISSGSNINIEKLEGIRNYATWKFQMKLILIDHGLWEYVNDQYKGAPDSSKDQKAYAKICLSVKPICYPHVRNAQTATEAWNNLKRAYENVGISRRLQLKRKLSQIKYVDYSTMDHYLGEIISVTQELFDIGCVIDDEEIAEIMIIGLPSEFDPLVMAIEATQTKLTSEFVKARLIQGDFKRNEYMMADLKDKALAVKEAKFLQNFFSELGLINLQDPITIYNDNQSTHKIVNNQTFKRTKHIDIHYHFVKEVVDSGQVIIKYKATTELVADLFTKALPKIKHKKFVGEIGLNKTDI